MSTEAGTGTATVNAAAEGRQTERYLSFMLGGEEYGVDILRVQEIKVWDTVTRVPYSPPYVLGVINLRGSIVPVIDLRIRFGLERVTQDATTVIIVVQVPGDRAERTVGMVVDAVADVHDVARQSILPLPDALGPIEKVFVRGLADQGGKLLILLDIEGLIVSSLAGESKAVA
jgi:purine-binding chemotaxis protein CheW